MSVQTGQTDEASETCLAFESWICAVCMGSASRGAPLQNGRILRRVTHALPTSCALYCSVSSNSQREMRSNPESSSRLCNFSCSAFRQKRVLVRHRPARSCSHLKLASRFFDWFNSASAFRRSEDMGGEILLIRFYDVVAVDRLRFHRAAEWQGHRTGPLRPQGRRREAAPVGAPPSQILWPRR